MKDQPEVSAPCGRVLIVDDDPAIRSMFNYVLAQVSLDIIFACDGSTALRLMQAESVDLALIDYHMPGMTGIELAAIIREHQPSLPLAMMTARASSISAAALDSVAIRRVFAKPFDINELLNWLEATLSTSDSIEGTQNPEGASRF